jgi:hypothetical protein
MDTAKERTANRRGQEFEARIFAILDGLQKAHSGFVEINVHPEIKLLNGQVKRPDFELVYRIEQEHRELIECQSRDRSSSEIANKIRNIKSLSARNRFVFIFEDFARLGVEHRIALESDGVNCLSFDDFTRKISQIDLVLCFVKQSLRGSERRKPLVWSRMWDEMRNELTCRRPEDSHSRQAFDSLANKKPYEGPS